MPSPDSAVKAGLMRTPDPDMRASIMREISKQLALNPNDRKVGTFLLSKDKRGDTQIELEKLAGEGVLERRFILGCPECGEFEDRSWKKPLTADELPIGKEFRCKECKHRYTAQHHDFYCTYYAPDSFLTQPVEDPRIGRDHGRDQDTVEKAVKRRLRKNQVPFLASDLERDLDVPGPIVRANLAVMVRLGELSEHNVERCPACGHDICSDAHEIEIARIGCLEVCPECSHGPFVVTQADVYVSYDKPGAGEKRRHGFAASSGF